MKIALANKYLPSCNPNGVSVQVHILAKALVKKGHKVTCYSFSEKPSDANYDHVKLSWGTSSRIKRKFVPARKFKEIKTDQYDIVHYHGDDYLCRGASNRVRTFYGSALQEAINATNPARFFYQALFYLFEWISSLKKGTSVAISKNTVFSLPLIRLQISCAVSLEQFHPGKQKTPYPSILFVGDLDSRKRGKLLLSVFEKEVLPEYPECILTVVGSRNCSGSNVRYCGNIPVTDLIEEYQKSWICCIPSSYEGFGVPAIEAMACGTPVVATRNAGINEIITDKLNGRLCTGESLGNTINETLSDSALRQALICEGVQYSKKFDVSIIASEYEKLYEYSKHLNINNKKYS
jgi:glycosyltransferase involved in cell wall biosynthesis